MTVIIPGRREVEAALKKVATLTPGANIDRNYSNTNNNHNIIAIVIAIVIVTVINYDNNNNNSSS